jgi:hypothetical protein
MYDCRTTCKIAEVRIALLIIFQQHQIIDTRYYLNQTSGDKSQPSTMLIQYVSLDSCVVFHQIDTHPRMSNTLVQERNESHRGFANRQSLH